MTPFFYALTPGFYLSSPGSEIGILLGFIFKAKQYSTGNQGVTTGENNLEIYYEKFGNMIFILYLY